METKTITVHHFDDEPRTIEAIRETLHAIIRLDAPQWLRREERPKDGVEPWILPLHLDGGNVLKLCYRLYDSSATFIAEAKIEKGDLVILDYCEENPDGTPCFCGGKCREFASQRVPLHQILFLSAYINSLPDSERSAVEGVKKFAKPTNVYVLARVVMQHCGLLPQGK